jgi:hypothetical protein
MIKGTIQPADLEPPKGIQVKRLLQKMRKMYVHFTDFLGEEFKGPVVPNLCDELRSRLGLSHADLPALRASLEELIEPKQLLGEKVLKHIILKFMQNKEYIMQNQTIPKWTGYPPVWSMIKIEDEQIIHIKEIPFARLDIHCLTGIVAGERHQILLPIKYVRWVAKEMGFPKYEKAHERDVVGMVSFIRLELTKNGRMSFGKVSPTSGHLEHNRGLARARLNKDCAFKTLSCVYCGLGMDKCPLATRRKTKETQHETSSSGP